MDSPTTSASQIVVLQAAPAASPPASASSIEVSSSVLVGTLDRWANGFVSLLPNMAVAAVVLAIGWALSKYVKRGVLNWSSRHGRDNLGAVLGSFLRVATMLAFIMLALTVVLPNLHPADLVAGLGIGSVAIGFAFKDILQNWLAGMLLLIQRPFARGDQIVVNGQEGAVQAIEARVTSIKTPDGRLVLVPNSNVYTNTVTVTSAFDVRRFEGDVRVARGQALDVALQRTLEALRTVEGVLDQPAPEVLVVEVGELSSTLRPRWWVDTRHHNSLQVKSKVLLAAALAIEPEPEPRHESAPEPVRT